ncbi:hypothetical protein [Brevibacterium otitidis]|uniref:Uncharacterized protein n=1 Tax=Brevibacterium otitidis TaxID=53364 RepID=A0ABV5X393_9MICO|nr:hypothetical protein GCM10023233_27400 [Brevibacterium otitidis]
MTAPRFDTVLADLVRELREAGIGRVDWDPSRLIAPCAVVTLTELEPGTLDGDLTATWETVLIAPDLSRTASIRQLASLLGAALTVIDTDDRIRASSVSLPSSGQHRLPALIITHTTPVKGT